MASQTINGQRWADGTSVSVYPAEARVAGSDAAPTGSAVTSSTVAAGTVTFTGLAEGRRYLAYAAGKAIGFLVQPGSVDLLRPISGIEAGVIRDDVAAVEAGTLSGLRVTVDSVEETATDKAIIALPSTSALLAEAVTFPRDTHTSGVNLTAVTVINVDSTANFAATGKIHIREITMTYVSKTSTSFTLNQSLAAYGCPDLNDDEVVGGVVTLQDGSALPLTRNGLLLPNGSVINYWTRSGNELRGTQGGTGTYAIGAAVTYRVGSMRMDQLGRVFIGANYFAFTNPSDNDHKNEIFDFMVENGAVHTRGLHLRENGDPVDLIIDRSGGDYNLPYGPMSGLKSGENMGTIRWRAGTKSAVSGAYTGMRFTSAAIYARLAEDAILEAGGNNGNVGAAIHFATVPIGGDSTIDRMVIKSTGDILIGATVDSARLFVQGSDPAGNVLRLQMAAAQSANPWELRDSADTSIASISPAGRLLIGRVEMTMLGGGGYLEAHEQSVDPPAPAANDARLFARDNGSGKTQWCVRFATGAVQVLATEP